MRAASSWALRQPWSLPIIRLQRVRAFKRLDFIVSQVAADELKFDDADLVEEVVAVFVTAVQDELEEGASHAEVHCFQLSRLEARTLVAIEREVPQSAEEDV